MWHEVDRIYHELVIQKILEEILGGIRKIGEI